MDDLHRIDDKLAEISQKISFLLLTPTNIDAERKRFFKDTDYNPQFTYPNPHADLNKIRHMLVEIEPDDSVVGRILKGIRDKYLLDIELLESRGTDQFQHISKKTHGRPERELVAQAKKLIYLKVKPESIEYSTQEILSRLRMAFVKYGVNWQVEEKSMIATAAVKISKRKLLIKKNSRFSHSFLKRIIVHEIGTHIVRAENGRSQPYKFFARGLPGYLKTEEGLAVYNEEINDCLNNYVLKIYAGRVLAIDKALKSSFSDTYRMLRKYFTRNTAWRITLRAKRGLSDTSKPGAFTKDLAYLNGYLSIKEYVKNNGDLTKLYYGKIGLQHIELMQKIPHLVNPRLLPMLRYANYMKNHFSSLFDLMLLDSMKPVSFDSLKLNEAGKETHNL